MRDLTLLFCGDVVGRPGREAVLKHVPRLRAEHALDFVVVSGDNAARGFGITPEICREFFACGVDVITGGDHVWDQKETHPYLEREPRLLRPHNFPDKAPGKGWGIYPLPDGRSIGILHLLGQVFHKENLDCPFACADRTLATMRLGQQPAVILVDMHAEATSEKNAIGQYLDGRVSAVVGSHTHVPTADARILRKGTAYQTDVGMCGDYDSIIGFDCEAPLASFTTKVRKLRMQPAAGEGTLCAALIVVDGDTGLARSITHLRLDGMIGEHTFHKSTRAAS
jgi:2',3'-cyclic-nucleotide 2'-phosphodiesterase